MAYRPYYEITVLPLILYGCNNPSLVLGEVYVLDIWEQRAEHNNWTQKSIRNVMVQNSA
jgi:hypothetical protein